MPQHEVGYRPWTGQFTSQAGRWWIIADTGFRLVFKSNWVRRLLFLAWLPIFYWGAIFFAVENPEMFTASVRPPANQIDGGIMEQLDKIKHAALRNKRARQNSIRRILQVIPGGKVVAEKLTSDDPDVQRHAIWSFLLMTFFRYPQAIMIIFLLGFISPGLISRDFRSRAFLLYFSRPIGRIEYILGKIAVPSAYLMLVTTFPALILYVLGVSMSPDLSVVAVTWDIPLRILCASAILIIPCAALSLMLSSLTQESRFASFAWFAVWVLGTGAWLAVWFGAAVRANARNMYQLLEDPSVSRWSFLSLYNNLGSAQSWIFGLDTFENALPALLILIFIAVLSFVVLFRRVSAPVRI